MKTIRKYWDRILIVCREYGRKRHETLGDFTTTVRVAPISLLAVGIGLLGAVVAWALLRLIGLFTNLSYYHQWSWKLVSPAGNHLGLYAILVPIVGALIVGFMARYGSERIRGHGIPEALESILMTRSNVEPRLAILKPLSSAISIGTGGPFGAEGPIIMTGGSFGSLAGQLLHLTSAERKTLLVAGSAAGMAATFAAPVSSVLLAVELLLFEWKPRSAVPVALASAAACAARYYLIGPGPLFPTAVHPAFVGTLGLLGCALTGLLAGILSALLTGAVYAAEDAFRKLPFHWMWWPALGGLVVGIGGMIFPQALGVGYDTIGALLKGHVAESAILGILIVKSCIWAISLGSGTSGGVLAPLLMMGGALGGILGMHLPAEGTGFWELVSMGAILGGTMRSPFTGTVFALELTHDINMLLPLLVANFVAHGFSVLVLKRSILTEKLSRRGYHLGREYAVDPMEILLVHAVMATNLLVFQPDHLVAYAFALSDIEEALRRQPLFPVLDDGGRMCGVVTRGDLIRAHDACLQSRRRESPRIADIMRKQPVTADPNETLRAAIFRMAKTSLACLPVVAREDPQKLLGLLSLEGVLEARSREFRDESVRERVLDLRVSLLGRPTPSAPDHVVTGPRE